MAYAQGSFLAIPGVYMGFHRSNFAWRPASEIPTFYTIALDPPIFRNKYYFVYFCSQKLLLGHHLRITSVRAQEIIWGTMD